MMDKVLEAAFGCNGAKSERNGAGGVEGVPVVTGGCQCFVGAGAGAASSSWRQQLIVTMAMSQPCSGCHLL